jgi:hypothetical protein
VWKFERLLFKKMHLWLNLKRHNLYTHTPFGVLVRWYISQRPHVTFLNMEVFYAEELAAPRPAPKLEDHPMSAIRDCLLNIFAVTP